MPSTITEDLNLDDYRENIQVNLTLPHVQIISPRDKSLPFGFFIPLAKAAEVEFSVDAPGWKFYDHSFGGDEDVTGVINKTGTQNKTVITDWLRIILVKNTSLLAFHPNNQGRSMAVGSYYANGALTEFGEEVEKNRGVAGYFKATRHLLYFLDSENKPLHTRPLQFKAKGGFGGNFGSELRLFHQEFDRSSFDGALGTSGKWNEEMQALIVFPIRLSIRQNILPTGGKGAWYCCIAERMIPTHKPEMFGVEHAASRKDGAEIKLVGCDWRSLLIPKKSEFGLVIRSDFQEHREFGKIIKPEVVIETATEATTIVDLSVEQLDDMPY